MMAASFPQAFRTTYVWIYVGYLKGAKIELAKSEIGYRSRQLDVEAAQEANVDIPIEGVDKDKTSKGSPHRAAGCH